MTFLSCCSRKAISRDEIKKSKLASRVVGTRWTWAGIKELVFLDEVSEGTGALGSWSSRVDLSERTRALGSVQVCLCIRERASLLMCKSHTVVERSE